MAKYQSKLIEKRELAAGVMAFRFEKPDDFLFKPGQHVDIILEELTDVDERGAGRDLSIASAPHEPWIEIATRIGPSRFKQALRDLSDGSAVLLKGPGGDFMLHGDHARSAVFLTGGIGITPVRSILRNAAHEKLPHRLFLFYANRTLQEALYWSDLEKAAVDNPNLTFIGTMTRLPEGVQSWSGERGRITKGMVEKYISPDTAPVFYLTGSESFVKAMRAVAEELGADDISVRVEEFPGY